MYWDGDWSGWTWFAMGFSMLVFWGLVAVAIWLGVRAVSTTTSASTSPSAPLSPEDTLRRRYAEGQIDEEEFNRRLRVLRGDSVSQT
jgi:putative membrane protein